MGIILWIVFGALVGWVTSLVMGTSGRQGGLENVAIGIVGAVIGGFIAQLFGFEGITGFNLTSFIIALIGAGILIALVKMFTHHESMPRS
ncbi:MAG: GlsB/YeaQ/YmgE family stress response membrane protein [Candidatus Saccharimonadales bacterium]